jgi:uncharacterized protein
MSMPTLHGRSGDLTRLLDVCQLSSGVNQPRLVVLYGRRRVGKTFLLQHLRERLTTRGSVSVYAAATREASGLQLQRFADAVEAEALVRPSSTSWSAFWQDLASLGESTAINLFLDEVPYLIESDPSWPSVLQSAWDAIRHSGRVSQLTIILTGSAISTMTNLISSRGALFERPDVLMRLDPFDLPTATSFLRTDSPTVAIEAYTACDGYPLLLQRWDPLTSATDNLVRLAGDAVGALATNASTLLLDLGDTDTTYRVLGAIGRGAHRLNEINARAGQRPERPLALLERSGLVERSYPMGERAPKTALLRVGDNYLRFWFALIEPHLQLIDGGQGEATIRSQTPHWERLVADVFERQARAHAVRLSDGLVEVGEWWTDRPEQAQIDVVERDQSGWKRVGEVKWKDVFTLSDFRRFERHLRIAGDRVNQAALAVWSRHSVSDDVRATHPGLACFTAADVCGLPTNPVKPGEAR